ncbi:uncharacterized protein [Montipora foliosa]|uniref:uncharacterized protein n=1 Tax=Montipora foliosa TaxID=591990 RepID=UPI0035F10F56
MVYCLLQFSKYFFENFPGYSLSPLRMSISRLESLFGSLKFQAHGNLSAGNYGSSLGRVQVRRELDLTSRALSHNQMFYRDEEALVSGTTHISNTAASDHHLPNYLPIPAHYVPYGFNGVKEFIFPLHISQSTLQGRNGSSACTLIALAMGQKFHSRMFEEPQKILDRTWFLDVVHSISQGNNIFDALFPTGQLFDVEDVLEAVGVELQLASYEEPTDIFLRGNDFSGLVKHVRDLVHLKRKSVGVIVCCQRSVALLVSENGSCAIFDSHQHLGYGCVLCHSLPTKEDELCFWLGKTFQRFFHSIIRHAQITWVDYS